MTAKQQRTLLLKLNTLITNVKAIANECKGEMSDEVRDMLLMVAEESDPYSGDNAID